MLRVLSIAWVAVGLGLGSASAHDQHVSSPVPAIGWSTAKTAADEGLFRAPPAGDPAALGLTKVTAALPAEIARRRLVQTDAAYLQVRMMPRIASPDAFGQPKRIAAGADSIQLNLFADTVVDVIAEKLEHTKSGDLVWQGALAAGGKGGAHLVISRGRITGSVASGGISYTIYPDRNGNTVIDQIDPAGFPKAGLHPTRDDVPASDKPLTRPSWMAPADGPSIVGDPNTMSTVTLAVAYTQAAAAQSADIISEINLAVSMANTAYVNSGVNITLQLVGTIAASYDEGSKSASTVINEARQGLNGSGELSELNSSRRALGADIVALIVKDYNAFQACGIAYMMLNPTLSDASLAVSASMRGSCITGNQTLAHEIGHNMGLAHDRYAVSKYNEGPWYRNLPQDYDYFGYVDTAARELTVMSYFDACRDVGVSCSRMTRFSNPGRSFTNGSPSGIALGQGNPANNTRVLNVNKDVVARWRPADPSGPVLTVAKSGTGSGRVTSSPSAINCGSTCSAAFTSGTTVQLTASASTGSVFTAWSDACSGSGTTANVTVSANVSCTATFTLNNVVTRPANDAFASATAVAGDSGTASGSNVEATEETGEPNHAGNRGGRSVWWTWTPATSGSVTFATTGSSFDTLLAAYTGSSVGALTLVAANDDAGSRTRQSSLSFNATAGQTYRIAVDGYNGAYGSVALRWTETFGSAPANDAFVSATPLTRSSGTASGTNRLATKEAGEPGHAGNAGSASVWWKITPTRSRRIKLNTAGSNFDTTLAVYIGSGIGALTLIAQNDDTGNTLQSAVSFAATAGVTYYVAVDGHGGATGSIALNYSGGPSFWHQVENGWWWSPSQPGSGVAIEQSGDQLYVGAYLYDANGRSVWYVSMGTLTDSVFTGQMVEYTGGQSLRGAYRAPALKRTVGTMKIVFSGDTAATVSWPGGTMPIQRFDFVSGGATAGSADGDPETGWWWSEEESGRGYFIETQGADRTFYLGGYMYDTDGAPVWYIASGGLSAGAAGTGLSVTGTLSEYANGQSMGGAWRAPDMAGNRGTVTFQFVNAREAILTLPDGRQVTLTRFVF